RGRIVEIDLSAPAPVPRTVIAESDDTIVGARVVNRRLLVSSLHNASSRLEWFALDGAGGGDVALPGIGSILALAGNWQDERALVTFTSFTSPPALFECSGTTISSVGHVGRSL